MKPKKCKYCKEMFEPIRPLQYLCSPKCAALYASKLKEKKERKETAEKKKELLTHKDWLQLLQKVFNTYIRLRDKNKPCISCGKPLGSKFDAGHLWSVGNYPALRFNELNVHGQCVHCNQHRHGNLLEYQKRIVHRIGECQVITLERIRNESNKLSIPEIQELIKLYKKKIKDINALDPDKASGNS